MDFLDPRKRRSHTIRLFIGYGLVGIALLIGTSILALYAYGYDFNRKTRSVVQNGLVFLDSHPVSADIYLNGESKSKTSARLVLSEGHYDVELRSKGYRTWKKSLDLSGSELARLVYPLLVPEKLTTKDVELFSAQPSFITSSPDRHWLILQKDSTISNFNVYDLTTATNTAVGLTLPTTLFTPASGTHSIELVEWSSDNRRLVVKHSYTGGSEYVLIDRESPTSSQNLSKFFDRPNTRISLRDKKYDQYYLYDSASLTLSTAELKSKTVTALIEGVLAFKSHGSDTLLYKIHTASTTDKDSLMLRLGGDTYALRDMPRTDRHLLDIARFDSRWYIVAASPVEGRTYVFRDPHNTIQRDPTKKPAPVAALRLDSPTALSFSANYRFIAVQSGSSFAVYDNEDIRLLRFDTKLKPVAGQKATWMDGHRLVMPSEGKIYMFDFDGNNLQPMQTIGDGFMPFFDKDYKASFAIGQSATVPGRTSLQRTELRVPN